jgi:hypothetical protein
MALQIKGKFIQSEAIDGSKLKLKQGESLRAVDADGTDIELLKIGPNGEIIANGDELALDADLEAEKTRAQAAEAALSSSISSEASRAQAAEASLASDIGAEQTRALAAEAALSAAISAEEAARQAAVSAEQSARQAADSALSGRLDVIEGLGEGSVAKAESDAKAYADQKIADLVASAPAVLDTLKELADAINGDENFASTVAGQIGAVQAEVDAEESRAQAAEAELASDIAAEETRALAAEAALSASIAAESAARAAAVSAEAASRSAADVALQAEIDAEEARASAAELGLSNAIAAEETRALAAEAALQSAVTALQSSVGQDLSDAIAELEADVAAVQAEVDAEEAARAAAVTTLQNNIDDVAADLATETSNRQAAVSAVEADLAAEETRAMAAEAELEADLAAESAARVAGDASTLASANSYADQKIADLVASAPAVLDTLKELADAIGGDANFAATIAGQIGDVAADLAAEETRALAAEASLASDIAAEEARAMAAEALKLPKAGGTMTGELVMDNADLKVKNPSGQVVAHFDASESSAIFGYASPDTLSTEMVGGAIKVEAGVNLGGAQTFIGAGFINLQESNGSAAMPTLGKQAAPKAYVDQEVSAEAAARGAVDSAHNTRISALEGKAFHKFSKELTSTDIANGYITLSHLIEEKSSVVAVGRLMAHEGAGLDYTVSTVGGVSRITFLNSLVSGGEEALVAGDFVFVQYRA